ncbi:MAG: dipeptidyl-peptidase 3 family protein [Parahaliea sp.]
MKKVLLVPVAALLVACNDPSAQEPRSAVPAATDQATVAADSEQEGFRYIIDRFADIQVLAYQVPGFGDLSLQQKELLYYLYQAAYAGRDIMWDPNYRHNLRVRRTIESIVRNYRGDRGTEAFASFMTYARQVWFANGIHHHYSTLKFQPAFSKADFAALVNAVAAAGDLPLREGQDAAGLIAELTPILFDPTIAPKKVNTAADVDKVAASAVNFYADDVTEEEVRAFYAKQSAADGDEPVSHGLNSKLVKGADGKLRERVWKVGGMYSPAIEQIVVWLSKAIAVAENDRQRRALELLVKFYRTGDLRTFDDYSLAWVEDADSRIDVVNGYIEVYNDPIAYRGSYESVVSFRDEETSKRIAAIGAQAQWFEDHSPIMDEHKRASVTGILGKAITVVAESGDASPSSPIGINLPNANWIRASHGSKSVNLSNIVAAHDAIPNKALHEFAWDQAEIDRSEQYKQVTSALHTDMHEVIGHASGRINSGVGTPKETLKQYSSTLEEGRADLVALYYMMDPKLVEMGLMPSLDAGRAEYDGYVRNGILTQLYRLKPGELIEEAHMRNRAMVARWAMEMGADDKVIERRVREGKTYFVVNDYQALRTIFGRQLRELQRIKSEGDFDAIQQLVENYGTQVDPQLHAEVLARYAALDVAPYRGFVNPYLDPVVKDGRIVDIKLSYPQTFEEQMMYYAEHYSFLPNDNG